MSKNHKIISFLILTLLIFLLPNFASAFQLIPSGCTGPSVTAKTCGLTEIFQTFINFANFLLSIVGSVALLMFVFGGFTWLTSGGSSDKVKKGRDIMVNTAIGLAIIFGAATVIYSVGTALCRGNQACVKQLNIYSSGTVGDSGIECADPRNDGKSCGKNKVCVHAKSACLSKCEASEDYAAQNFSCMEVVLLENTEEEANKYSQDNPCILGLCPGDWDNLCCQPHETIVVDKCCACTTAENPYDLRMFAQESTEQCQAFCQAMMDLEEAESFDIIYDLCPDDPPNRCGLPEWMDLDRLYEEYRFNEAAKNKCRSAIKDWKNRR